MAHIKRGYIGFTRFQLFKYSVCKNNRKKLHWNPFRKFFNSNQTNLKIKTGKKNRINNCFKYVLKKIVK